MRWALTNVGRVLLTLGILSPPGSLSAEPISITVDDGSMKRRADETRERGHVLKRASSSTDGWQTAHG